MVTPGAMCRPTSSSACAASRPATRIARDGVGVLDLGAGERLGRPATDVLRPRDGRGHGPLRADHAGHQDGHATSLRSRRGRCRPAAPGRARLPRTSREPPAGTAGGSRDVGAAHRPGAARPSWPRGGPEPCARRSSWPWSCERSSCAPWSYARRSCGPEPSVPSSCGAAVLRAGAAFLAATLRAGALRRRGLARRGLPGRGLPGRGLARRSLAGSRLACRRLAGGGLAGRSLARRGLACRGLAGGASCGRRSCGRRSCGPWWRA